MNLFAKFHENIPNLSQETEKNTENVPPSPKKLNSKSAQVMGNIPPTHTHTKSFCIIAIRVLSTIYVQNFITNQMVLQKKRKKYHKTDQKYPKMASRRGGLIVQKN